jgi:SAM-dependent methyltransferase
MMIAALARRHERAGTLGQLSALHRWMWAGDEAVKFHQQAQGRFVTWWLASHCAIVEPLRQAIAARAGQITTLCEIGCGSGLVLEDLSRRLPEIDRFIGLDLSPTQTQRNRARFSDARLQFEAGDATSWIPGQAKTGWAFLTNAGVLEYLSETQLASLLAGIAERLRPAVFALLEPIPKDYDLCREIQSRPHSFEKSLGHNYPHWLKANGWTISHQSELQSTGDRFLMVVAFIE